MKPTRLLLIWLATLLGLSIVQGALRALGIDPGPSLQAINWALLLALLVLALLDAAHLLRRPSPSIERRLSGSLALGRWAEVQVSVQHDYRQPLTVELFDHVPDGLSFEQLPHSLELQPGQTSQFSYRLRPLRRGHFSFQQCEINLPGPLGLWSARRYLKVNDSTRVYPDFAHLYGAQLLAVDSWISQLGVRQRQRRGQGLEFHQLREFREGDSLRQIDWKATARQRTPIARVSGRTRPADHLHARLRATHAQPGRRAVALRPRPQRLPVAQLYSPASGRCCWSDDFRQSSTAISPPCQRPWATQILVKCEL